MDPIRKLSSLVSLIAYIAFNESFVANKKDLHLLDLLMEHEKRREY